MDIHWLDSKRLLNWNFFFFFRLLIMQTAPEDEPKQEISHPTHPHAHKGNIPEVAVVVVNNNNKHQTPLPLPMCHNTFPPQTSTTDTAFQSAITFPLWSHQSLCLLNAFSLHPSYLQSPSIFGFISRHH